MVSTIRMIVVTGVTVFTAFLGDSNACSYSRATADISVFHDPVTGEKIEVHASAMGGSAVVFRIIGKCDIGENKLCPRSVEGN